jgi:hypothetical protein
MPKNGIVTSEALLISAVARIPLRQVLKVLSASFSA